MTETENSRFTAHSYIVAQIRLPSRGAGQSLGVGRSINSSVRSDFAHAGHARRLLYSCASRNARRSVGLTAFRLRVQVPVRRLYRHAKPFKTLAVRNLLTGRLK